MKTSLLLLLSIPLACSKPAPQQPSPPDPTVGEMGGVPKPRQLQDDNTQAKPVETKPAAPKAADAFAADCRTDLAAAKTSYDAVVAVADKRTIDNTLEPYNEMTRALVNALERSSLWQEVHPDAAVRDAARACESEGQKFISEVLLDKRVFDAVKAVDVKAAPADTQRFVMQTLRDYKRAGIELSDDKRARMKQIDEEITKLGQEFSKSIAEDTHYVEVKDAKRLEGMPADWVAAHKPDASGVIKISTDYPDYDPVMSYAKDDSLRKDLYIAFRQRGEKTNEQTLSKVLALRAEKAKLLGFKDWADYESDDKMLRTGKAAAAFIEKVAVPSKKRAQKDYAELLAQLKKLDPKATAVADWQKAWLAEQVKQAKYQVDAQEVRKYFPFEQTLAGLLEITGTIYDIQYKPVTDPRTWHASVKVFDVMRGSEVLGRIFLDMHPRADKYKHAAQFGITEGMLAADGKTMKQLPSGALVCNFPESSGSDAGLMEHGDVVTMFHEFGHLMHHVLGGKHHWVRQSGVATEADFVEAPSQMFEEWGWRHETLSRFAKNAAGEVIPAALVEKMRNAYKFGRGTQTAQQMFYAALSLQMHTTDPAKLDQLAMVNKLQAQYTPFAYVEGTKFHTSFGHLIGYSSRYYTYMWSLAIAKDMLTAFDKSLLDTKITTRYRDKVLAAGGSKDAADLVKDFLGRPYNFKAFEKFLAE